MGHVPGVNDAECTGLWMPTLKVANYAQCV